jgi:tetratricopeptide (TPR) repeat protein
MLMRRGNYDRAVEKFRRANAVGPHFADPLELWGEALSLAGHANLAIARFEEANKFAPQWGRPHLKWAEALERVGQKDAAQAQFKQTKSPYTSTCCRTTSAAAAKT